ncbi:2-hydroxyisoflavanone dehydratase-like [Tripterygium wilfordii]|uniref:2-hydroxyisoflavanone dehydratase-like n=1 Tax=Tripterygium wilfordii TaxID=458696 RepID=UPI0018F81ED9|nr:2-hydroxyisoflavanone dehydratase-like [Tripterygium wilfordii]
MASPSKEVAKEIPTYIRLYTDGSVERPRESPYVPPSPTPDPVTGVTSKDITISENPKISARLFLPKLEQQSQKLPILVHFHGGGFFFESAFSFLYNRFLNLLVSEAKVVAVSVEYRLAPEHPLPAAYDDCWAALNWVASHSSTTEADPNRDSWLLDYGDFDKIYIGGDSAGANLTYNIAMRAGSENLENNVKILGAFIVHPYFWSSKPIGSEPKPMVGHDKALAELVWDFIYPSAAGGIDNPMINPVGPGGPSLATLGCGRLLVCVAEKDKLKERGVWFCVLVKESGWRGELELYESEGEEHVFHILTSGTTSVKDMIKRLASFLK